jgi:riboflavin kinase/FMN adenylyltransferase
MGLIIYPYRRVKYPSGKVLDLFAIIFMKISGTVIKGKGEGRGLGFPTANIKLSFPLDYSPGVYLGEALVNEKKYKALVIFGVVENFEVWLDDFEGDLYGQKMEVNIGDRLSEVIKLDSPEQLIAKINSDINQARKIWATN